MRSDSQELALKVFVVSLVMLKGFRGCAIDGEGALVPTAFPIGSFPWDSFLMRPKEGHLKTPFLP